MSLISFPLQLENIASKVFYQGPETAHNPSGFTGRKREYSYTVPTSRVAFVTISLGFSFSGTQTGDSDLFAQKYISLNDYVKSGDTLYVGSRVWGRSGGPFDYAYDMFYILNGVTVFQETISLTTHNLLNPLKFLPVCYISSLEMIK